MAKGDYGYNGRISAPGFGSRRIRSVGLDLGLGIISSSDNEARQRRAFYSIVVTGSSFTIMLAFVSYEERERFARWFRNYIEAVVDGEAKHGYMTIQVPSRRFVRTAVPESEIEYGEGVTDVGYVLSLKFMGASDPLNPNLSLRRRNLSYFKRAKKPGESRYFYPAGRQTKGAESLDGTIFDSTTRSGGTYRDSIEPDPADPDLDPSGVPGYQQF